jgi:HEPN domain-containing protein
MSEVNNPMAWVERAEEGFVLAGSSSRRKKPLTASACFHAQQCAEKYLKALLVSRRMDFPKTHDLLLPNNLCSAAGIFLEIDPKLLNTLTDFAIRTRYPGQEPALEDAKEAVQLAKLVRKPARNFLGK